MPRKRFRLIVGGETLASDIPGLRIVERSGGRLQPYWRASERAARLGFQPKNIELKYALVFTRVPRKHAFQVEGEQAELDKMIAACRSYEEDMSRWKQDPSRPRKLIFNGTFDSLIEIYLSHPHSPFRGQKQNTQQTYREWCEALSEVAGKRRVDRFTGPDLRAAFDSVRIPKGWVKPPRDRLAYGAVRQMPRILVNFGMELGLEPCYRLNKILTVTRLKTPVDQKTGRRPRKKRVAMSYEQASAIVKAGLARGTKQYRSVALGVAAQFEFALNQIDVIGWWDLIVGVEKIHEHGIIDGGYVWRPGLTYEEFEDDVLDVDRSKTGVPGIYDVREAPLFQLALAAVPEGERRGAVTVDSRGIPMQRRYYVDLYRELADEAGVPATIKNMHARHGAASEADDAGVDEDDITRLTRNTKPVLRGHYLKGSMKKSREIAKARVESRDRKNSA